MVTQAPKRAAVLAALAFTLSCIGLIDLRVDPVRRDDPVRARRATGSRAVPGDRAAGAGRRRADLRASTSARSTGVQPRASTRCVTMDIHPQYAPIPADTRAILREKTLLGEAYVELSAGNRARPQASATAARSPPRRSSPTQQLDQVLASFDKPTQHNLQALLTGTLTVAGRPRARTSTTRSATSTPPSPS